MNPSLLSLASQQTSNYSQVQRFLRQRFVFSTRTLFIGVENQYCVIQLGHPVGSQGHAQWVSAPLRSFSGSLRFAITAKISISQWFAAVRPANLVESLRAVVACAGLAACSGSVGLHVLSPCMRRWWKGVWKLVRCTSVVHWKHYSVCCTSRAVVVSGGANPPL